MHWLQVNLNTKTLHDTCIGFIIYLMVIFLKLNPNVGLNLEWCDLCFFLKDAVFPH